MIRMSVVTPEKRYSYNYQTKIISLIEGIMNRESLKSKLEIMPMDLPGY
jgi:hypothetical protein